MAVTSGADAVAGPHAGRCVGNRKGSKVKVLLLVHIWWQKLKLTMKQNERIDSERENMDSSNAVMFP